MSYPHFPRAPMDSMMPTVPMNVTVGQPTPQLTVIPTGTTVLAHYHEFAWYFGLVQNYNLTRNGNFVYQVLFRSGEIRSVASPQVLSQQSNNQNIEIGSRVVVQHPTKSMFISSLIAELPSVENMFRYLLFLDDGSACYKTKEKLWVINLVENPILMLPPNYKAFIQRYFMMSGTSVKLLNINVNDLVLFTNFDSMSLQFTGKITQVDCSIVLVRYNSSTGELSEEWIHRGSNRILSLRHSSASGMAHIQGDDLTNNMIHVSPQNSVGILPNYVKNSANMSAVNHNENEGVSLKRYVKSPLKSKQFMVPPTLDPFMFSDDEDSLNSSNKFTQFNNWTVEQDSVDVSKPPIRSPHSVHQQMQRSRSPIIILDESPDKKPVYSEMTEPPPPYLSPPKSIFPHPINVESNISDSSRSADMFLSPTSEDSPRRKPSSVFSWSAPVELESRRHLKLSPKVSVDADFDFADTILNNPSSNTPILVVDNHKEWKNHSPIKNEIIIIDEDSEISVEPGSPVPPSTVLINLPTDDIKIDILDNHSISTPSFPMIIHQEACNIMEEATIQSTTMQNGNTIEVVVGSDNGETVQISVAPSTSEPEPVAESVVEINNNDIYPPNQEKLTTRSRKRRIISPLKSPKTSIPKLKINLRSLGDSVSLNSSKDLAAQKCVKRARKQQSRESNKDHKQALAQKKQKISNASLYLFPKKEPIKLNSEAKIARWTSPWSKRHGSKSYLYGDKDKDVIFGQILQKVESSYQEEELEEGEIDDSESEEEDSCNRTEESTSFSKLADHACSFFCNKFNSSLKQDETPLSLPMLYGWRRDVNESDVVSYTAHCGKQHTTLEKISLHLHQTKCTFLNPSNFCFHPDINLDFSVAKLDFEPIFTDNDLSNGMENVPVSFVSNIGPIIKYNFHYIVDSIFDLKSMSNAEIHSCNCEDNCTYGCPCKENSQQVQSECNNACKCSINCPTRLSQRGLKQKLQIVQRDTSFYVNTLHDIPPDTFICILTGLIKKSCPSSKEFVYPLSADVYRETVICDVSNTNVDKPTDVLPSISRNYYHDESSLLVSADLENVRQHSDNQLTRFQSFHQCWVRTATKHNKLALLSDPNIPLLYPSSGNSHRDTGTRSKRHSSSCSMEGTTKKPAVDFYLDCSEFGNVGRFIRIGKDFNTIIRPVLVDSVSVLWLALYTCHKVQSQTELIIKPFDR